MSVASVTDDIYTNLGLTKNDKVSEQSANELAQEDFLELMIAQLTNQDPFEPMDNGDFLAQMAQFSTVSGIDELNASFSSLSASLTSSQAVQAGALVDRDVLVEMDYGVLPQGGALKGMVDLPTRAGNVVVNIKDATGALIKELSLGTQSKGRVAFSWDGSMDDGDYAPPGVYSISTEAVIDDENTILPTLAVARVESVSLGSTEQGLILNLSELGSVAFNNVTEIR